MLRNRLAKHPEEMIKEGLPIFYPGDTIKVGMLIIDVRGGTIKDPRAAKIAKTKKVEEKAKSVVRYFKGVCIARHNNGTSSTFTVRNSDGGFEVEKVFPLHSPLITGIEVLWSGHSRAKLYYLRGRFGKKARIKRKDFKVSIKSAGGAN